MIRTDGRATCANYHSADARDSERIAALGARDPLADRPAHGGYPGTVPTRSALIGAANRARFRRCRCTRDERPYRVDITCPLCGGWTPEDHPAEPSPINERGEHDNADILRVQRGGRA
jgi:rRNA maturation protein Nop10